MSTRTAFLNRAMNVFLATVERGGNALPHPGTLFAILAIIVIVISAIAARTGLEVVHPGTGELIQPVSLAAVEGLHRILTEMVTNFTGFAPLGTKTAMSSVRLGTAVSVRTVRIWMQWREGGGARARPGHGRSRRVAGITCRCRPDRRPRGPPSR